MSTWHGLAGATPAAESGGDTSWMRNAADWTDRLERAAILPSERPTYHQATLSGGADKELSFPEPMQNPLSYVNGSSLPDAADKPFQELAQKVERLERAVQDLQGWRVALASQAPLPPQPMDAAVPPNPAGFTVGHPLRDRRACGVRRELTRRPARGEGLQTAKVDPTIATQLSNGSDELSGVDEIDELEVCNSVIWQGQFSSGVYAGMAEGVRERAQRGCRRDAHVF